MARIEHYDQGTPSWVELVTPDQSAANEFYGALFGWSHNDTDMGDAGHYYVATLEGDEIGGISGPMPGMEDHPAFWGVYLAVDDVDAVTAKVEAAGGKVEAGPFDVMENGRMSAIQDRSAGGPVAGQADHRYAAGQRVGGPHLERVRHLGRGEGRGLLRRCARHGQ